MKTCSNCGKVLCPRLRKGLCDICYTKQRIYGDVNHVPINPADSPSELTENQISLITGHMLGDGFIDHAIVKRNGKLYECNSSLSVMRKAADAQYLEYSVKLLHNLFATNPLPLVVKDKIDKRTKKNYRYVACGTRNLTVLNKYRSLWYDKDGVKFVPRTLELNPLIIAIWFCDDGWIDIVGECQMTIGLATNGFTESDVRFLVSLLENRYGSTFNINAAKNKRGELQYTINAPTYSAIKLIRDIDSVFPDGMDRKRVWSEELLTRCEASPRVYSYKQSSAERKTKVFDYIGSVDEFTLTSIGMALDWMITRGDGSKEVPTSNISKYVEPFVTAGFLMMTDRRTSGYNGGNKYIVTESGKKYFRQGKK